MSEAPAIAEDLFEETAEGPRLVGSKCNVCGTVTFPKQASCAKCTSTDVERRLLAPRGELWSWTIQGFRPKTPYTGPEDFEPYGVGYIELPGECRVESILTESDAADLRIGAEMELTLIPARAADGSEARTFAFTATTN